MIFQHIKLQQTKIKPAEIHKKIRTIAEASFISLIMLLLLSTLALAEGGGRYKSPDAWSFGVHGDTQWTIAEDSANPNFVAGSILKQVNDEFINHGVKFVIALGDMSDRAKPGAMSTRSEFTKPLYDAGIGFFPIRGNHETYGWFFNYAFLEAEISAMLENFPQTQDEMFGAYNLSSPEILDSTINNKLKGLSYSFDFGPEGSNVRFVIVDTEDSECEAIGIKRNGITNPYWPKKCRNYPIPSQQEWISDQINKDTRNATHVIVLSHRPPMGQNHIDSPFNPTTLFGEAPYYPNDNLEAQDIFFKDLFKNGVRLYLGAHDHIHHRSIIKSPDEKSQFQEIIAAGLSTKFYEPSPIPYPKKDMQGNVVLDDQWFGQKSRETSLSQEVCNIGYYVYTVDGPRITADYYSDIKGNFQSNNNYPYGADKSDYPKGITPELNFVKKETFGYSLNGREFLIKQGDSYTVVQDRFEKTNARILYGLNNSLSFDGNKRKLTKAVETGWIKNPDQDRLISNIFSIWGMSELGKNDRTDIYVLSISIETNKIQSLKKGKTGIATFVDGKWINAVDENFGGKKKFIIGKYKPQYGLGAYGIDPQTKTAWAVLNYNADFAIAVNIK